MLFQNKVVVVTGGAQGIGKCCAECFERDGAIVHVIDIQQGPWFVGDLSRKPDLERFAAEVIAKSGHVDVIVNNAMPLFKGINECSYEEFAYAQAVGVVAPFYLSKLFKDYFAEKLGHVPVIDPNPRRGDKVELAPARKIRYRERSTVERGNSDLKDNYGARHVRVKGHWKVLCHLMFGVIAITVKQLFNMLE